MAIKKGGDGDDNGGGGGDEWFSYSYDILTLRWKEAALLSGKGEDVTRHQWKMMAVMIVRICTYGGYEDHMDFEAHENWEDCGDGDSDEAGLK